MASVNKVILVGHLGKDAEVRYAASGDAIANFSVATSESWKDKTTGEKKEQTEWHRCVAYRKLGEIAGQYLKKGSQVYIEGKLKTRKWQDKDGQDRYSTEIQVDELKMLGGKSDSQRPADSQGGGYEPAPSRPGGGQPTNRPKPSFDDLGDDIPFLSFDASFDMQPQTMRRLSRYF